MNKGSNQKNNLKKKNSKSDEENYFEPKTSENEENMIDEEEFMLKYRRKVRNKYNFSSDSD